MLTPGRAQCSAEYENARLAVASTEQSPGDFQKEHAVGVVKDLWLSPIRATRSDGGFRV